MSASVILIRTLHVALIMFVILVPFVRNDRDWTLDALHVVVCLSLLVHWKMNNDACFLTLLESWILQTPLERSFMHQLVSPIYKIDDDELNNLVTYITMALASITATSLYRKRKQVTHDISRLLFSVNIDKDQ